ncbi:FKBP4 [Bugula neritina]|uniref:peptidylprolyl isomerase n=1 Tax=Bugula neritina TaxID=10212 RepID=A0A7J7JHP8_BUGNE|nr:FKBP4 [Bugula neritina]
MEDSVPATDPNVVPDELLQGAVDVSKSQDGGVQKVILKEGTGEESPGIGDQVVVHYVGTLANGSKFDSSRDRNDKFKFKLGQGQVIKAWDDGVASMKKGEVARLICRSDYGYGKTGSPPKIPADATLVFEVELFEWKVEVKGVYDGRVFDERTVSFTVSDAVEEKLPDGFDVAIKKFKKGESSKLTLSPQYGLSAEAMKEHNIPEDATIQYEVKLVDLEKAKESWEMEPDEKLSQSELAKSKGTNLFKKGELAKAVKKYLIVIKWLDDDENFSEEQKAARISLRLAAHLNCALCYIKQEKWPEAKMQCNEALSFDEQSEKALFRRGQAYMGTKDWVEARSDFQAVLNIDSSNKTAKNQLIIAEHKVKQERERERKLYASMFTKMTAGAGDSKPTQNSDPLPDTAV